MDDNTSETVSGPKVNGQDPMGRSKFFTVSAAWFHACVTDSPDLAQIQTMRWRQVAQYSRLKAPNSSSHGSLAVFAMSVSGLRVYSIDSNQCLWYAVDELGGGFNIKIPLYNSSDSHYKDLGNKTPYQWKIFYIKTGLASSSCEWAWVVSRYKGQTVFPVPCLAGATFRHVERR